MSVQVPAAKMNAILSPLCEETGTLLKPIYLRDYDYLTVKLNDDGRYFVVQALALSPADGPGPNRSHLGGKWWNVNPAGPSMPAAKDWAVRCPERKEQGYGGWELAATDFTALVMRHAWPDEKLIWLEEGAKLQFDYLLARFLTQSKAMDITGRFKLAGEIPPPPGDAIIHPDNPLMPYQWVPINASLHSEAFALFMEQGTGKTSTVIGRVCIESARKRAGMIPGLKKTIYRVLVICPLQVRLNWQNEFERFATVPGKIATLRGGDLSRATTLYEVTREDKDFAFACAVISHDSIESSMEALKRIAWDLVVIDESHSVKNPRTQRFKAIRQLRDAHVRQRMVLTGTPIANNVMDLWGQLECLADGMSGFLAFETFRGFYGQYAHIQKGDGKSIQKLTGLRNVPLLQERLARCAFICTKKEVGLNLPEKVYDIYEVEMTPVQAKWYATMAEQLLLELEQAESDETKTLTAEHVLTKLLRLAQITSGHVRWDRADPDEPGKIEQVPGGNPKVQALVELLTEEGRDPNGKTIVWAIFREDIRVITERLKEEGIGFVEYHGGVTQKEREEAVRKFNTDPSVKVFVANPAVAGAGLNLLGYDPSAPGEHETNTDHEIFFSQDWSAIKRSQAEDRAHRKGTRTTVRITDLCIPGTIDEEIRARVMSKITTALQIQDVREILRQYVGK